MKTTEQIAASIHHRRFCTRAMPTSTTRNPVVIELQFVSSEKVVTVPCRSKSISLRRNPRKGRVGDEGYR
jgi:hypothetical protein